VLGLAVIGVAFVTVTFINAANQRAASAAGQAKAGTLVTAFVGDLSAGATASGAVQARRSAQLSLGATGTVDEVAVQVGDSVKAGDVLVQLNADALARAVASAQQNLVIQEANLAELRKDASAADLASAQASVASAQASLEKVQAGADPADIEASRASLSAAQEAYASLLDGPDENAVAQAEANLRNAEAALKQAQAKYDPVSWRSDIGRLSQSLELEQATNNYQAALASYNSAVKDPAADQIQQARANVEQARANLQKLLDSPTPAELAAARAQLAQAEAQLASLTAGASTEKIAVAEAQVEQSRINLAEAEDNLAKATLVAPFDGVVTAVHVAEGEIAGGLAIEMADMHNLDVVLDVDEVDVGALAVGQPAVITLETWPGAEIDGEVVSIAPQATAGAGAIVSYEVRLSLGQTDLPVRIGMTANADLITAARQGVLLVPNQAITPDRAAGKYVSAPKCWGRSPDRAPISHRFGALTNLLANALRHTPAGGAIAVGVETTEAEVQMRVQDTGEGIAAEHLPLVFDRFYRTDRARDRDRGGAGLGLAIVRAMVAAHGGRVTAESPGLGQGSTFAIHLPRGV